jgi:hypothetical protein
LTCSTLSEPHKIIAWSPYRTRCAPSTRTKLGLDTPKARLARQGSWRRLFCMHYLPRLSSFRLRKSRIPVVSTGSAIWMSCSSLGRQRLRKVRPTLIPAERWTQHITNLRYRKLHTVSILSSLLTPTVHPNFSVRFVSHESLLQAQNGGGGAIPYSPEVVVDVVANLVTHLDPG